MEGEAKRHQSGGTSSEEYVFPHEKLSWKRETNLPPAILVEAGSFSPITFMHVRLMEQCRDHLFLNQHYEVIGGFLSPVGDAYNKKGLESAAHRVAMCQRAVSSSSWLSVDTWEAKQTSHMRTVLLLRHLEQQVEEARKKWAPPSFPRVAVILACGADLLASLEKAGVWADEDVLELLSSPRAIVCLEREGTDLRDLVFSSDRLHQFRRNVHLVHQSVPNSVSSTTVRKLLRRQMSIKYLVPDEVEEYIKQHNLFAPDLEKKVGIFGNF